MQQFERNSFLISGFQLLSQDLNKLHLLSHEMSLEANGSCSKTLLDLFTRDIISTFLLETLPSNRPEVEKQGP